MPYTVKELDSQYMWDWSKWPVPEMPDLPREPWDKVDAYWKKPIIGAPVDGPRTNALPGIDIKIGSSPGRAPWQGTSYGMPFNLVDAKGPTTPVWDLSQPVRWNWFTPTFPISRVPLPHRVVREGDPASSSDVHWIGFDPMNQVLWEAIQLNKTPLNRLRTFGQTDWCAGYDGSGLGIVKWDCNKPWDGPGQPKSSVVATNIPKFPHIIKWEEIVRGRINHALFLGVPNYDKTFIKPARGSDGDLTNFPLRGGERLRMKRSAVEQFPLGSTDRIVAEAAWEFGMIVADRNSWNKPFTQGGAGFSMTQDTRWAKGDSQNTPLSFECDLSDLEVVVVI